MVLADTILERMTDRKIGAASSVKACNALKRDLDRVGKPHSSRNSNLAQHLSR